MTYILLYSLFAVWVAMIWSVLLAQRARDRRMYFLTAMLAIMSVRLTWTLLEEAQIRPLVVSAHPREITEPLLGMVSLLAMVFLGHLLSDFRKAEAQLRQSEQRYRGVIEDQTEFVIRWQPDGALSFVNEAYCRNVGQPRGALIGTTFAHALKQQGQKDVFTPAAPIVTREHRVFRADGRVDWEEWTHRALFDARGQLAEVQSVGRDVTKRQAAEEALFFSEDRYRSLVEDQPELVCRFQPDGTLTFLNRAFEEYFGQRIETLQGSSFFDLIPASERPALQDHLANMGPGRLVGKTENKVVLDSGEVRWQEWTNRAFVGDGGEVVGFQAFGRDVSDRKVAEEELVKAQSLLLAAIEQVPAGILIADAPDGTIRIANSAALGIRGYTAQPLTDIPLLLHPENWQTFRPDGQPFAADELPLSRAIVHGETSKNIDLIIRRSDGEQRWVLANAAPVRDAEGRIIAGVAVFPDITERKRTDAALHKANQALASHMNNSPLAMIEWDSSWRIRRWSRQAEKIFGWKEAEVLGKHWMDFDFVPEEDLPAVREVAGRLSDGTENDNISYNHNRVRGGQMIHCEWYNSVLRDGSGLLLSILSLVHDVTQRRRAEEEKERLAEQLRHMQKMEALGQLAGGVAHDFNNLLTSINGNADILQDLLGRARSKVGLEVQRALSQIRSAGGRGASLTRQLLAFGRKEIVHSEIVAPAAIVADMEEMLRRLIGAHIDLQVVANGEVGCVLAGSEQIQQIVMNLVVNAADAMPRGGRLTVELGAGDLAAVGPDARALPRTGRYVKLVVRDTGTGMTPETQSRIFEPFFTTKPVGKGTGLGLSTVYGTVNRLGGHIDVASAPGQGSTFSVLLPAVEAPAAAPAPKRSARGGGGRGEVVLVCEDEDMVRDVTSRLLLKGGYTVLAAENGRAALNLAVNHAGRIDLLISDVVMPDMNGRELAEALCARQPDMAVLYVSGYTADVIDDHGLNQDGAEFMYKPFVPRELLARVRQLLDKGKC